jgi:N-acetylated-alpha-linked acidic dipeptidase
MIGALLLLLLGQSAPLGFFADESSKQLEAERFLLSIPSPESFGAHLLYLTEEPHPAGSRRNMELADYVRDRFLEYGLEDVHFHDTPALYSHGREAAASIVKPIELALKLKEDPHPEDKDSYLYSEPGIVAYHEYAASGEVEAQVVYANSGSPEDFQKLRELGIDLRGKIVLMRYSNPYSYRGYKVHLAQTGGAAAAIIYSDPADDGYARGPTYPRGPWGPPSHIQWGSIVYDWLGYGTIPFTFHWKQDSNGRWVEGPERDRQLPGIPSMPMSHEDAAEILSRLGGPPVPREWQGALPFTYHLGPGPVTVKLRVKNEDQIGTMRNVIGRIEGSEEPEKWIVVGNHRDAWSHGAVDPSSGTAALLETARALGAAAKKGLRPRRTILFANWDAEEDLLGGSTSWAVDFREKLRRDGVLYVNLDSAASGPDFSGGATPALADYLRDVSRYVPHPSRPTFYDQWRSQSTSPEPEVGRIVGATDYTAFQENVGMSVIDLSSNGPYGVYHSQYDNYFWMSRIADPGFLQNAALARFLTVLVYRSANLSILPMHYSVYARAVLEHIEEVEKKAAGKRELRLHAAREAARLWEEKAALFERRMWERPLSRESRIQVNALLMEVERVLTEERGLKSRPFFKHLIYAPQPTYRDELLPRIWEAIDQGAWDEIEDYERELVEAFQRAASLAEEATGALAE